MMKAPLIKKEREMKITPLKKKKKGPTSLSSLSPHSRLFHPRAHPHAGAKPTSPHFTSGGSRSAQHSIRECKRSCLFFFVSSSHVTASQHSNNTTHITHTRRYIKQPRKHDTQFPRSSPSTAAALTLDPHAQKQKHTRVRPNSQQRLLLENESQES